MSGLEHGMKPETWDVIEAMFAEFPFMRAEEVQIAEIDAASNELGIPLAASNVQNVYSTAWQSHTLQQRSQDGAGYLKYRDVETNGSANINLKRGSIFFWYRPNWASSGIGTNTGPGHWVKLFQLGEFSLSIDPYGTNLVFQSLGSNGATITNFVRPLTISSPQTWRSIAVSFSPTNTALLRVGSADFMTTNGIQSIPGPAVRAQGLTIGSDSNGIQQVEGIIDQFQVFNYDVVALWTRAETEGMLSASVDATNRAITLSRWVVTNSFDSISRKRPADTNWTVIATNVSALEYRDSSTNLAVGERYEYTWNTSYLLSGLNASPVEDRGRVILLIDTNFTAALSNELNLLEQDLVGDGWKVTRFSAPRHDDLTWSNNLPNIYATKAAITNFYATNLDAKAIFILGHVSVPYSGYQNPDGHGERPWPTDGYYADVNGAWSDATNFSDGIGVNVAGDGRFDQISFPSALELSVGRVDFANLPWFTNAPAPYTISETDLLRRYLTKNHNYRHGRFVFSERVVAGSYVFNSFSDRPTLSEALRNGSRFFGIHPNRFIEGDFFKGNIPALWGYFGGLGGFDVVAYNVPEHYQRTDYFANWTLDAPVGFYQIDGSFFGDWNTPDNLLRGALGTRDFSLASMWGRARPPWRFEPCALGEPLGEGYRKTMIDYSASGNVHMALLGDPTLRLQTTTPPAVLTAVSNGVSQVKLAWYPPLDSACRFYVYRATNSLGPFARITINPLAIPAFTDSSAPSGAKTYQVRSLKLTTTGSGSFTNTSQGVFTTIN